jgi:hypothetical protein
MRYAAALRSSKRGPVVTYAEPSVASLKLENSNLEVALCDEDALLKDGSEHDAVFGGQGRRLRMVLVAMHSDLQPKGLPKTAKFVACPIEDIEDAPAVHDAQLAATLENMVLAVGAAWAPLSLQRVVFVCHAGINRSALGLCFYLASRGSCTWREARDEIVRAKEAGAAGWPTLCNGRFVDLLERHFPEVVTSPRHRPGKRAHVQAGGEGRAPRSACAAATSASHASSSDWQNTGGGGEGGGGGASAEEGEEGRIKLW